MENTVITPKSEVEEIAFLLERERYDQAERILVKALAQNPESSILLYFSAVIDHNKEDYKNAIDSLEYIIRNDPSNEPARELLSYIYMDFCRTDKSEEIIKSLISEFPEKPEYYTLYACNKLIASNDTDKADQLAKKALKLEPTNGHAMMLTLLCDRLRGNRIETHDKLARLISAYPEAKWTVYSIVIMLMEQKEYKKALKISKDVLLNDPDDKFIVDKIKNLRVITHPSMILYYPLIYLGGYARAIMTILLLIFFIFGEGYIPDYYYIVTVVLIGYFGFYYIYPQLLGKIIN